MIWQVWVVLVLIGAGSAYLAFVPREGAPVTSLIATGCFTVAAFGSFDIVVPKSSTGSPYHATETAAAVLFAAIAIVGVLVTLTAVAEQWGDEQDDDTSPSGGELREYMDTDQQP